MVISWKPEDINQFLPTNTSFHAMNMKLSDNFSFVSVFRFPLTLLINAYVISALSVSFVFMIESGVRYAF